jgi:hypothetical protein
LKETSTLFLVAISQTMMISSLAPLTIQWPSGHRDPTRASQLVAHCLDPTTKDLYGLNE